MTLMFLVLFLTKTMLMSTFLSLDGAIIQAHAMEIKKKLDETDEELSMAITEIRQRFTVH